ncbi:MAG: Flagellar biosynthesis protein FliQ, partial [uncultured Nocardioides sp.]
DRHRHHRARAAHHGRRAQAVRAHPGHLAGHRLRDLAVPVDDPDPGVHALLRAQAGRRGRGPAGLRQLDAAHPDHLHARPVRGAALDAGL